MLKNIIISALTLANNTLATVNKILPLKSIGVRVCIIKEINGEKNILLIRHTYKNPQRWYPPGGAVDSNEPIDVAAMREVQEETDVIANSIEYVIHFLHPYNKNDYVFIYKTEDFEEFPFSPNYEIAEAKWFPLSILKGDVKGEGSIDVWGPLVTYRDLL